MASSPCFSAASPTCCSSPVLLPVRFFRRFGHDAYSARCRALHFRGEHFLRLASAQAGGAHWTDRRHRDSIWRKRSHDFRLRCPGHAAGVRTHARPESRMASGSLRVLSERRDSNRRCVLHGLAAPHHASGRIAEPACGNGHGLPVPGFRPPRFSNCLFVSRAALSVWLWELC
jgi:hypothetical protein